MVQLRRLVHVSCQTGSLVGKVITAHPLIRTQAQAKTMFLIGDDDGVAPVGVALNRPTNMCLRDIDGRYHNSALGNIPVCHGGPRERDFLTVTAWVISAGTLELYYAIRPEEALSLMSDGRKNTQIRIFTGYTVFDSQIYNEINRGLWIVCNGSDLIGMEECGKDLWFRFVSTRCPHAMVTDR
jgi:putative AlgH/UPF0301 family transcriptional regulator